MKKKRFRTHRVLEPFFAGLFVQLDQERSGNDDQQDEKN
jgi:hypothetical protein